MSKTDSKPKQKAKPKFMLTINKQVKITAQISQKTLNYVNDYQTFLKEFSAEDVGIDALLDAFIISGITSDKTFIKWKKELSEKMANAKEKNFDEKNTPENSDGNKSHTAKNEEVNLDIS